MSVYNKADYYASYGTYLTYPDGRRLAKYTGPEFDGPVTVRLHYHPLVQRSSANARANRLLTEHAIGDTDKVIVFGCGFGWLCEALVEKTGCTCVGVELSQYVNSNKDLSPDDELIEAIRGGGLSELRGDGLKVFNDFKSPNKRTTATVLQEDLLTLMSKNRVKDSLKAKTTYIVTEEVWQELSTAERADYSAAFAAMGGKVVHIIDGVII